MITMVFDFICNWFWLGIILALPTLLLVLVIYGTIRGFVYKHICNTKGHTCEPVYYWAMSQNEYGRYADYIAKVNECIRCNYKQDVEMFEEIQDYSGVTMPSADFLKIRKHGYILRDRLTSTEYKELVLGETN